MVSRLKCNTVEDFSRGLIIKAAPWRMVISMHQFSKFGACNCGKVGFSWQGPPHSTDCIFDTAFLPGGVGIAEISFDANALCEAIVVGEFGTVVERDGAPELFWQGVQQAGNSGCDMRCCFVFKTGDAQQA